MAAKRPAKKGDFFSKEMTEKSKTLELNVEYTEPEMEQIKFGIIPEEMEDKWFIYYNEEEETLYLHRSWTGFCVYMVKFKKVDNGFNAVSAVVNNDPEQYKCADNAEEKDRCISTINILLLGKYSW